MKTSKLLGALLITSFLAGCHTLDQHSFYFNSGSSQLSQADKQSLEDIAAIAKEEQSLRFIDGRDTLMTAPNRVVISGYTDSIGDKMANQELAERRVSSVKHELIKLGVDPDMITESAHGEGAGEGWFNKEGTDDPQERRVDIKVY